MFVNIIMFCIYVLFSFIIFSFIIVGYGKSQWDFPASQFQEEQRYSLPVLPVSNGPMNARKKIELKEVVNRSVQLLKANWFRAGQYCRHLGMRLATINNQFEEDELERELETLGFLLGPIWTSGTDNAEEGKFFWMTTGEPLTYSRWLPGQPNGTGGENCMMIEQHHGQGYRWSDAPCSDQLYFACEYFPKNVSCSCAARTSYI